MSNFLRKTLLVVLSLLFLFASQPAGLEAADPSSPGHSPVSGGAGTIIETMNASGYTYLLVDSGKEQNWVAIPETAVTVGETVEYSAGMVMKDFHSKTLNRTFASIVFSPGLEKKNSGLQPSTASGAATEGSSFSAAVEAEKDTKQAPMSASGGSLGAIVPFSEIKVEKATGPNGHTIKDVFDKSKDFNGTTVRVRGKVMKINLGIMGRNWIHLQDGSGDPMNNTHDLVVTTAETPNQGEILTFEGKLSANKDFGAGYSYAAIIEDAKVVP
jgi:hypothetical protein